MGHKLFLSRKSTDSQPEEYCRRLEQAGLNCWIAPRNIQPGRSYAKSIIEGITNCDTFLVFISKGSLQSEDVLNEIEYAKSISKPIIPVFIENVELTGEFAYYLKRKQWIEGWRGIDLGMKQLSTTFNITPQNPAANPTPLSTPSPRPSVSTSGSQQFYDGTVSSRVAIRDSMGLKYNNTAIIQTNNCRTDLQINDILEFTTKTRKIISRISNIIERYKPSYRFRIEFEGDSSEIDASDLFRKIQQHDTTSSVDKWDVILQNVGAVTLQVVKAVSEITGLGLAKSKEMVDNAPSIIAHNISESKTDEIIRTLTSCGCYAMKRASR